MKSLRARMAALLIVAILTVVGLATLAASRALQHPDPEGGIDAVAGQIRLIATLAQDMPEQMVAAGAVISESPASGEQVPRTTELLSNALAEMGLGIPLTVSRPDGGRVLTISIELEDARWLLAEMPDLSPPEDGWKIFTVWIAMIVIGAMAVSLWAARSLGRPLELLEAATSQIGADGILPHMAESGPAEIRATARALNHLSDQVRSAMDSRMRLIAAAGHDLRTPMTRMRLRAEFIEDDDDRAKWLIDLHELDLIADSAIRLVREEAAGGEAPRPLRLDVLISDIAAELTETRHNIAVGDLAPLEVRADPLALKRALRNLIVNAATHGGGASVNLMQQGRQAVLSIRDDGPGIPEALLGQVFEPFFRADPARRKTIPGAGLGLAIAREIIERFGGRITIANLQPRGLVQHITLECAADMVHRQEG
ncbi:HAMP domain-containing protein (plasmid) [Paracoccus liaowanqingii]|uniref:histidine kinase n=1 Tax=Paracoccus liaowanqingii TaxID=2560053 RepID=A0A4Y5SSM8_9RHOB|nr:ATP-binding protein [Paracoccus liaowanqingii]QDA35943.1 HAMP domain-containing protein [Paracoccus liaowanqingii]